MTKFFLSVFLLSAAVDVACFTIYHPALLCAFAVSLFFWAIWRAEHE